MAVFSERAITDVKADSLKYLGSGKVRELFAWDDEYLVFVATDRLSAFDVVMSEGIPGKGEILTQMSQFWFDYMGDAVDSHIVPEAEQPAAWKQFLAENPELKLRTMFVKRVEPLAFEFVVRGYLSGSGWKAYQASQSVCGIDLPAGLLESSKLPEPILTPTTKAHAGHDEPVTHDVCRQDLGNADFEFLRDTSIEIFKRASEYAGARGIILADTKFEFGRKADGSLVLIDEIFTPDSARYWPADSYEPGKSQPSFDKQFVRDWLETLDWDKTPPAPTLPREVIEGTRARYLEAYRKLVGES
ncbi:MAG: phosphoribosylaminoimidazolesuccinocarboxamide synthase [Opitutales bacterium]